MDNQCVTVDVHKRFLFILVEQDDVLLFSENPLLWIVNLTLPVITPPGPSLWKTKSAECLTIRTNKRRTNRAYMMHWFMFRRLTFHLFEMCFFPLSLSLSLSLCLSLSVSLSSACPQGTFKSFQGAGLCQQCPLNSRSTIEAATLCGCRNGYYRGDMDKAEDVCTSESLSVKLTQKNKNIFSVNLFKMWV